MTAVALSDFWTAAEPHGWRVSMSRPDARAAVLRRRRAAPRRPTVGRELKKFLDTESITGRRMRQDSVTFAPTPTLVITTNYRPVSPTPTTGHGVGFAWCRSLEDVPSGRTPSWPRSASTSDGRGRAARSGSRLARRGRADLAPAGFKLPEEPKAITKATREWRESTDLIYAFAVIGSTPIRRARWRWKTYAISSTTGFRRPTVRVKQTFTERFTDHEALRELGAGRGKHQ